MKVTVDKALLEQALEALQWVLEQSGETCEHEANVCFCKENNAIAALRAALAEPAPEERTAVEPVTKIPLKDGKYLKLEPFYFLGPVCWMLYTEDDNQIRALDEFESGFVDAALKASPPPPVEPAVEPVAVHQVKLDARRWRDIAKDEMQNYIAKGFWETRTLYTSPPPPAESAKPPGMAVQALAGEIVAALLADEKDGGYDLAAGMFGPAFSALVRRWAAAEWNSPPAEPAVEPRNHVGNSKFESWYSEYNASGKGDKQRARDAYAAGMGDPVYLPSPPPPAEVPLTTEEYTALAHRIASKYAHHSDPRHIAYTFLPHTLEQFVREVEAAVRRKAGI